jgi:D-alanyl-D-alanine carboxypeptidase
MNRTIGDFIMAGALFCSLIAFDNYKILADSVKKPADITVLVNKNSSLSSTYVPKDLVKVDAPCISNNVLMRKEAAEAFKKMCEAAKKEKIFFYGLSGYRPYKVQVQLYNQSLKKRGKGYTDKYIATAGNSEHQTGLAIDVINKVSETGRISSSFGDTKEGKWLVNNAHKFGFILRYPRGKESITKINYEPWHFRYVGIAAAKDIKDRGIVLEEYLGISK